MSQIDAAAVTSPRIVQKSCAAQFPLIEAALLSLEKEEEIMFSKFIMASAAAAVVMVAAGSSANAQYRSGYSEYREYNRITRPEYRDHDRDRWRDRDHDRDRWRDRDRDHDRWGRGGDRDRGGEHRGWGRHF
jgi:hypothetical protein